MIFSQQGLPQSLETTLKALEHAATTRACSLPLSYFRLATRKGIRVTSDSSNHTFLCLCADPVVNKRIPRELEPYLYNVAVEARKTLPQGHFTSALTQRLVKAVPFNERTLKVRRIVLVTRVERTVLLTAIWHHPL